MSNKYLDIAMEKVIKQEVNKVLDEIRAEMEVLAKEYDKFADSRRVRGLWIALDIINKYRAKSEGKK